MFETIGDLDKYVQISHAFLTSKTLSLLPVFAEEKTLKILSKFRDQFFWHLLSKSEIAGADISKSLTLKTSLERDSKNFQILHDVRDKYAKHLSFLYPIDWSYLKNLALINDIVLSGVERYLKIPGGVDQSVVIDNTGKILFNVEDGTDITNKIKECEITVFSEGESLASFTATLLTDSPPSFDTLKIILHSHELTFKVEEIEFDKKENACLLWGRCEACRYFEPFVQEVTIHEKNKTAKDLIMQLLPAANVIYEVNDWVIGEIEETGYPLAIAKKIANETGAELRALPDGNIYIVYPDNCSVQQITSPILSLKKSFRLASVDMIEVIGTDNDTLYMEADKDVVSPGEWVFVRVYTKNKYTINTSADVLVNTKTRHKEVVTEELALENGEGEISKPILNVLEVRGCDTYEIKGQKITSEVCSHLEVDFETCFDEYKVTNFSESRKLVCSVLANNSLTLGNGTTKKQISLNWGWDNTVAQRRANRELAIAKATTFCEIETLFSTDFLVPKLLICIDDDFFEVISNKIRITSNPLKIKSILGARKCPL